MVAILLTRRLLGLISGRFCPFILQQRPHALHRQCPVPSLLHNGVDVAPQFTHSRPSANKHNAYTRINTKNSCTDTIYIIILYQCVIYSQMSQICLQVLHKHHQSIQYRHLNVKSYYMIIRQVCSMRVTLRIGLSPGRARFYNFWFFFSF